MTAYQLLAAVLGIVCFAAALPWLLLLAVTLGKYITEGTRHLEE